MSIEPLESRFFDSLVAEELATAINDVCAERGSCSVALSGGSTPGAVYRALSRPPYSSEVPWGKVLLLLGDERFVPLSDPQSNYRMIQETLVHPLAVSAVSPQVLAVDTTSGDVDTAARGYERRIREKLGSQPIDIVLLGMGEDGHFASIFPGSSLVQSDEAGAWCAAVVHPESKQARVTLTFSAIAAAKKIYFLVQGPAKAEMLQRVLQGSDPAQVVPSRLFVEKPNSALANKVVWLVDTAAAKLLR